MQKKSMNKTLFISLLITSTLLVSGCNHSSPAVPVAKVETKFQNDFVTEEIIQALTEAAKDHGWKIQKPSLNTDTKTFSLKKSFSKRETIDNPRGRHWVKTTVHNDVFIDVAISGKSLEMNLAKDSKNHLSNNYHKQDFNNHLEKLEQAIYSKLLPRVL